MFANEQNEKTAIQPTVRVAKEQKTIFERYIELTRKKLVQSLADANGRYVLGHGYKNPKPSLNWKVVGKAAQDPKNQEQLDAEIVQLKMNVGTINVPVKADGSKFDRQPGSEVVNVLTRWMDMLDEMEKNPNSEGARAFHETAIIAAFPKSLPKDKENEGLNWWDYNEDADRYDAVALSEEELAKAKEAREAQLLSNKDN